MKVDRGPILAAVVIAGVVLAATRFVPRRACRHRRGESPGARRRRAFQQAVENLATIRADTDQILAILEERRGT